MNNSQTKMRIAFLPVNQAWIVLWGKEIIAIGDTRFWRTRSDLLLTLTKHQLQADKNGTLTTMELTQ